MDARRLLALLLATLTLAACAPAAPTQAPAPTADIAAVQTAAAATVLAQVEAARLAAITPTFTPAPPTATPSPTPVPPTATPLPPTDTPPPTVDIAAVQAAAIATALSQFSAQLTATAQAIPSATATAAPTDTPLPTNTTAAPPTSTPKPRPTATPQQAVTMKLEGMRYERWGRPRGGCGSFDDKSAVRKFNLELTLTNTGSKAITPEDWYPVFYSNGGRELVTCYYLHVGVLFELAPGASITITFASFCELDEYVAKMRLEVFDEVHWQCFDDAGGLAACG